MVMPDVLAAQEAAASSQRVALSHSMARNRQMKPSAKRLKVGYLNFQVFINQLLTVFAQSECVSKR